MNDDHFYMEPMDWVLIIFIVVCFGLSQLHADREIKRLETRIEQLESTAKTRAIQP